MQSTTSTATRGLSVIIFLFLLSTAHAQIKIKERIDIAPKKPIISHTYSSSNNFPCFAGEIDPTFYWQTITVLRPCMITVTGTMTCEVPINTYANPTGTVTFAAGCTSIGFGADGPPFSCGNIMLPCNTTGDISDNSANCDIQGTWCCWYPNTHPIELTFSISAIPTQGDPATLFMKADPAILDAYETPRLVSGLTALAEDQSGNPFQYCGDGSIKFTLENPIPGVTLLQSGEIGPLATASIWWDGSDLPNGIDSVTIFVGADYKGVTGTIGVLLQKIVPPCLLVKIAKTEISPGDTVAVNIIALKNGIEQSYPADQAFDILMNTDAKYGRLRCNSTGKEGSYLSGTQPFEFKAADNIDVDSVVVELQASLSTGGGGGGGGGAIGSIRNGNDTLRTHTSVMASKQATPINIGDGSNGTIRKNIELLMDSLQSGLNKVSARKSNEKQQQKLALDKEKLKAQLAYETAKTPDEKQNALADLKRISKIYSVQETCNSTADVTIDGIELVVISPKDNAKELKQIDATPKMPDLSIKAQLKNYDKGVSFKVTFTKLQWTAPGTDPQRITIGHFEGNKTGSGVVEIPFTLPDGYIRGGDDMTIDVQATDAEGKTYGPKTLTNPFIIKGNNPAISDVCAEISAAATSSDCDAVDIKMLQILSYYMESTFKQFKSNPDFPYQGGQDHNDFGMMQINHPSDDDLVWNWKKNIAGGIGIFIKKGKIVDDYIDAIEEARCWAVDWGTKVLTQDQPCPKYYYADPKDSVTQIAMNPTAMSDIQRIQEISQRYNGGVYWRWVPTDIMDPTGPGKWIEDPSKLYDVPKTNKYRMYGGYSIKCMELYNDNKCPCQ
jgi:hypothetical protein